MGVSFPELVSLIDGMKVAIAGLQSKLQSLEAIVQPMNALYSGRQTSNIVRADGSVLRCAGSKRTVGITAVGATEVSIRHYLDSKPNTVQATCLAPATTNPWVVQSSEADDNYIYLRVDLDGGSGTVSVQWLAEL